MSLIESSTPTHATDTEMSPFAKSVYQQKYALKDTDGNAVEDWSGTALRVTTHVLGAIDIKPGHEYHQRLEGLVGEMRVFDYLLHIDGYPHEQEAGETRRRAELGGEEGAPVNHGRFHISVMTTLVL